MTLFSDSIMATLVIITTFPRGLQRKSDKLEMSKMFYFIYLMLMKSGIEYFFDSFNRSEVIIVVQYY